MSQASLKLDHLSILSRSSTRAQAFYDLLLPLLGFTKTKPGIWRNDDGLHLQFMTAKPDTADYARYGPGLNHFGFAAPDRATVERVAATVEAAGYVARVQQFPDGTLAAFMPDPDGLRIEVSHYPPGVPPVD